MGWLLDEAGGCLTNNIITNILNFIYQWLHNCWCWRGDYLGSLETTLQYSNSHLSLTGQLLVVKGWLLGEARGHLTKNITPNILNFIYEWLGNCWCWRGDYPEKLEATWQYTKFHLSMARQLLMLKMTIHGAWRSPYNIPNFFYHWLGNCWWWRFPCPCSHTHIYRFMYILTVMSNNLVNQSTKAISTNELRWIGPVLAVVSSGPMDLFLCTLWCFTSNEPSFQWELIEERCVKEDYNTAKVSMAYNFEGYQ